MAEEAAVPAKPKEISYLPLRDGWQYEAGGGVLKASSTPSGHFWGWRFQDTTGDFVVLGIVRQLGPAVAGEVAVPAEPRENKLLASLGWAAL